MKTIIILVASILGGLEMTAWGQASVASLVTGTISVPGETDGYTFNVPTAARYYFDALTNNSRLQWSLAGPAGTLVTDRAFTSSDSQNISDPVLNLVPGDYTLRLGGTGDATGAYAFRFINLAEATLLSPGSAVTNTLAPANETDLYQFTANPGDRFLFNLVSRTGAPNAWWRLVGPHGNTIFAQTLGNVGSSNSPVTLVAAGTYTLLVEGYIADNGNATYAFNVIDLGNTPLSPLTGTPLVLGEVMTDSFTANTTNSYRFTLTNPSRLAFDNQTNSPSLNWSLEGPSGLVADRQGVNASDWANNVRPLDLPAGDYQLRLRGSATSPVRFRLLDLDRAPLFNPGTPVNGPLSPATASQAHRFNNVAGTLYYFDSLAQNNLPNAYWRLINPFGAVAFSDSLSTDQRRLTLGITGTYTLLVEGYYQDNGAGSYGFNVLPVTDAAQPLTLGAVTSGTIASPGQRQLYRFTLGNTAQLVFDARTNNSNLRWSLDGPAGNVVNSRGFTSSDGINLANPVLALLPGEYTLSAFGNGDAVGAYQFRLFDLATAPDLTPGTPVNSASLPANSTDARQFTLAVPGRFFFDFQTFTGLPNAAIRLIDAFGNVVFHVNSGSDAGPLTLSAGRYFLLVEGYHSDPGLGSYTLNVAPVTNGSQSIVLGTLTTGVIATPGQVQRYAFNLGTAARLYFDAQTNNSSLRWSLSGPAGAIVNNRSFTSSDGLNLSDPLLRLQPGDHVLSVSGNGDAVGAYQFRLFDLATADDVSPGTNVLGALTPASATEARRFSVTSAGEFYFDNVNATRLPNAYWRLVNPFGQIVFSANLATDQGPLTLQPGAYTLLFEGYHSDPTNGVYTFNVHPVVDGAQALTLGALTAGTITTPGQQQRYRFTLSTPATLYFDTLTNLGSMQWSLSGPAGSVVRNRAFTSSDGLNTSNPLLPLDAGDYTLTVNGAGDNIGSYQFRVLDLAEGTSFVPGTPISATNLPGNQTTIFRFTTAAGDRFFFDRQGSVGLPNAYWRLVDPLNNLRFSRNFSSDAGTNTLPVAGTYSLLIEGYYNDPGPGSFTFNVRPEGNVPPVPFTGGPLLIGETVSGSLAVATAVNSHVFSLGAPARLLFDGLVNAGFRWSLQNAGGVVVAERGLQNSDSADGQVLMKLGAGDYQLNVTGATGDYAFRLLDLAVAIPFAPGNVITNTLSPARSSVLYQFTGTAGAHYFFDGRPSSGFATTPYCHLYAPMGNLIFEQAVTSDLDTFTLPQSGTYILTVEGRYFDNNPSGNFAFNLQPVTDATNALTIGSTVSDSIATVGQRRYYPFALADSRRLYFDVLTNIDFVWHLDGPAGQVMDWRSFQNSDSAEFANPVLSLAPGQYQLAIAGSGFAGTGAYHFRLLDLAAATPFTPGTVVSNSVAPGRGTVFYTFNGVAGNRYFFDGRAVTGFSTTPYTRLYSPLGNILFDQGVSTDVDTFSLPQSGAYTLSVEGRYFDTSASGNFAFNLQPVVDTTNTLGLGTLIADAVATAGQRKSYTFTLPEPRRLYFDALTNFDFIWRLDGPGGTVVDWRSFQASDSADIANPVLALGAGDYQLTVVGTGFAATGAYRFQLLDLAGATPFIPGNVVSNSLAPARSTVFHQFNGTAGDRYYFDGQSATGFSTTPYTRLYSPLGTIVFAQNLTTDEDTFILPHTGVYTISVEGRYFDTAATGAYAFNLVPNPAQAVQPLFQTNAAPDLVVASVNVTPASGVKAGDAPTVAWTIQNQGRAATSSSFVDRLIARNTVSGEILVNSTLPYTESDAGNGPILPGATRSRQLTVNLPRTTNSVGTLEIAVTTDVLNNVLEQNSDGPAEGNNSTAINLTVAPAEQLALFVNVHGTSYDGDGFNFYQTLVSAGARALYVNLDANGKAAALFQTNQFEQVWVFDLSSSADNYPADWQAIATWYNSRPNPAIICDGRSISSYWSGRWQNEGLRLTKNYYENLKLAGGGLMLGTDHNDFHAGINSINSLIGLNPFVGNFSLTFIPVDVASPLMTFPNSMGAQLFDDSSPGQTPFGLQPNGRILYTVAWHSGNTNTPGISSTIRGGVGFRVRLAAPANTSQFDEEAPVVFQAQPTGGTAPITFEWSSDRDGALGTGATLTTSTLSPGQHRISVVAREAGGGADTDAIVITIRAVAPTATLDLQAASDTGAANNDNLTSDTTPTFDVVVNKRGRLEFDHSGDGVADETRTNLNAGLQSFTLPAQADGPHTVTARFVPLRGEPVSTSLVITVDTVGPRVIALTPAPGGAALNQPLTQFEATFDSAIATGTVNGADASVTGPSGTVGASGVSFLATNRVRLTVPPQRANGAYELALGPNLTDLAGNAMNQDADANNGEPVDDVFRAAYTLALPDLRIVELIAPTNAVLGLPLPFSWTLTNQGPGHASAPWQNTLSLATNDAGDGLRRLVTLNLTNSVPPGASVTQTGIVTIPAGLFGRSYLLAIVDAQDQVGESDEANNAFLPAPALDVTGPDLVITEIVAPATGLPGESVQLSWTTVNQGDAPTAASWSEQVFLSTDAIAGSDLVLASFTAVGPLAPGASLTQTQAVTLPNLAGGSRWFVVRTDSANAMFERVETNNNTVATAPIQLPAALRLTLNPASVREDAGVNASRATVTRNTDTTGPLTVTLLSSDPSEASVPPTVIIPAGQTSTTFFVGAVADAIVDGTQTANITARAGGLADGTATITVQDVNVPALGLTLSASIADEGDYVVATLTRDSGLADTLAVQITSSSAANVSTPSTLILLPGVGETNFMVQLPDDTLIESTNRYTINAVAAGYQAASAAILVRDNDLPEVTFTLATTNVSENAGSQAVLATLHRSPVTSRGVVLELVSSDPSAARVPLRVTIPPGSDDASFYVAAVNDDVVDGTQTAVLRCFITDSTTGARLAENPPVTLNVLDDDGPTLQVTITPKLVAEGISNAATATVTRNTPATEALLVNLESSNTNEAVTPLVVTIPLGSTSATFPIHTVSDGVTDDNQDVTITASAPNFTAGHATIAVSDVNLPDLTAEVIALPATGATESFVSVRYRIANQGLTPGGSNITTRLFLSRDSIIGDDILLGQYSFSGTLPPGTAFDQTVTIRLPQASGDYWIVAQTDVDNAIAETLEGNNAGISSTPLRVQSAYNAVVQTDLTTALAGTPVPLTGLATGAPAGALVNIHIYVNGTHRIISAVTEAGGAFATTWRPLPTEAGVYQIGAAHPGERDAAAQDTFTLLGFRVDPGSVSRSVIEGGQLDGSINLINLSDVPLTGVTATVLEKPANLDVTLTAPGTIPGSGAAALAYQINALDPSVRNGLVRALVRTSEGATNVVSFFITVESLRARLVANPSPLLAGMVRGDQTIVEFEVSNTGGATSGPVSILLPAIPWLRVVSTNTLAPLVPGATNRIALQLTPPESLGLGEYRGTIILDGGNTSFTLPFNFRAVSDLKGDLLVRVVDEFTYYAEGSPAVSNATVLVRDAVTRAVVANGVTDADGNFYAPGLTEAYYDLEVSAERHNSGRETALVLAARTNTVSTFLPRQMVQYRWTVEPTTVEDRTKITIETKFETVVPAPVITIEPALIDLSQYTAAETQIELNISNHGLIAAGNFRLNFGSHPNWELVPLISQVGTLPPRSSLSVPMMIRRKAAGGGGFQAAAAAPCTISGNGCWELLCGLVRLYCAPVQVINAGGNCGSPGGPGGPGWPSPGGNGGPSPGGRGGPIFTGPTYSLPDVCDCTSLPKVCLNPSLSWKADGMAKKLASMVLSKLPNFSVKKTDVSFKINGEICSCCKDKQLSYEGSASGTAKISVTVAAGPNLAIGIPLTSPPGWTDVNVTSFDALLGVEATLSGSVELKVDRKCAGDTKLCVSGGVSLTVFAGAQVKATVEGKRPDTGSVKYSGELDGQLGTEGTLSAKVSGCSDTGWRFEVCGQLKAKLHLTGSLKAEIKDGNGNVSISIKEIGLNGDKTIASVGSCGGGGGGAGGGSGGNGGEEGEPLVEFVNGAEYLTPDNEVIAALAGDIPPNQGVCAKVRLQLDQEAVLARDAFRATLEIDNDSGSTLENLGVEIEFKNAAGQVVSNLFVLRAPDLSGLNAVDGTGTLANPASGKATWILLPTVDAAPDAPLAYLVGGTLTFTQEGRAVRLPLAGAPITVHPLPQLKVDYFHQRDVLADDPFTEDITEPSLPFSLAVLVHNTGRGVARQLRIASAQPKIIENEKGLLIDFKILASEVAGQNLTPSLTVQFGDIAAGQTAMARWLFSSTLQGLFTEYSAKFENLDIGGNSRLAIITNVAIHEMIQMVWAPGEFDDGRPDFLVNAIDDPPLDLPDTLWFSNGSNAPVAAVTNGTIRGTLSPGNLVVTLDAEVPAGWTYLRVADPGQDQYRLVRALRADGREILRKTNVWTTDRTFIGQGQRPVPENIVHLLDYDSPGRYTLYYEPVPTLDTNAPTSQLLALPATSRQLIPLRWEGSDNSGGSGLGYFDIFVSTDGGNYTNWLARTVQTSAIFPGETGRSYRFYSVATDRSGNTEAIPATPDATTSVQIVNRPPVLGAVPPQSLAEGETLRLNLDATDPDGDALTFTVLPGAPAGLTLNPANGQIVWPTGELQGPSTTQVRVAVTDNGVPSLAATQLVQIIISEVNSAPTLEPIADFTVLEGQAFTTVARGTDADSPAQALTYALRNSPASLTIDAATGALSWLPGEADGGTTNRVSVVVSDNFSPSLSATQTFTLIVLESNQSPVLQVSAPSTVTEGESVTFTAHADDADRPAQQLTFSLVGAPTGANIDARSGAFSWTPSELQGPGTNVITVRVTDDGEPAASAETNLTIVVLESNTAPVLTPIPTQITYVQSLLRVTNVVFDADVPTNRITFRLASEPPRGLRLGTNNGVISWTPGKAQAPSSNLITVIATDDGVPPLSATNTFSILVGDFTELTLGSTVVRAGETGRVAITMTSSVGVTNLSFELNADRARITNFALAAIAPDFSGLLQPLAPDRSALEFGVPSGQPAIGTRSLADLQFNTVTNQTSAFVPLSAARFLALQGNGVRVPGTLINDGRVVVIGAEPLLEALPSTNGQRSLILYGRPQTTYTLEFSTDLLNAAAWQTAWRGTLINLSQRFDHLPETNRTLFYRAIENR